MVSPVWTLLRAAPKLAKGENSLPSFLSSPFSETHHVGPRNAATTEISLEVVPSYPAVSTAATLKKYSVLFIRLAAV